MSSDHYNFKVERTERGWAGHFCAAHSCRFRRNTLLYCPTLDVRIVVSTVGLKDSLDRRCFDTLTTAGAYFETMAFYSNPNDQRYHDADVTREISFESDRYIYEVDADDKANDLHEVIVQELSMKLSRGEL